MGKKVDSRKSTDPMMENVRATFEKSGKSLDRLGQQRGHKGDTARKAVWQFLNKVPNPRVDTLRAFARAMEMNLKDLF